MTREQYLKISEPYRSDEKKQKSLQIANQIGTAAGYLGYLALLVSQIVMRHSWFWRVLLIPAVAFAVLSLFRRAVNAPRPYEVWQLTPLLEKDTKGKSFPSRHVFSAAIIAMAVLSVSWIGGILLLADVVLLAWCRVVAGVHFIKDVGVGAIVGAAVGLIGFFII